MSADQYSRQTDPWRIIYLIEGHCLNNLAITITYLFICFPFLEWYTHAPIQIYTNTSTSTLIHFHPHTMILFFFPPPNMCMTERLPSVLSQKCNSARRQKGLGSGSAGLLIALRSGTLVLCLFGITMEEESHRSQSAKGIQLWTLLSFSLDRPCALCKDSLRSFSLGYLLISLCALTFIILTLISFCLISLSSEWLCL